MMTKKAALFFMAYLLCNTLAAMDWPVRDAAVIHNFGYNDRGRPILGTAFEGEGDILAADDGELIFSRTGKDFASRLPSPLGAWTAIDHGDGLISVYGRHEDSGGSPQMTWAARGTPVASTGSSGWSRRKGAYFVLYDRKERRWVNPSMVIAPFPDTVQPQILSVQLLRADGRLFEGAQLRNVSQGRYAIIVNAVDTLLEPRGLPLAPHRIVCSVNGEEAGALSFETICSRNGLLMVSRNGLIPAQQAYARFPAYETGEVHLSRGQAILEIIVQDIMGNTRNASIRMIVE
ncbi:MAG: hypothetical protein LBG95_07310 [Treponema sp.]|jgi:hypothetical protein|nr:hypothetical protein [Treponema sp.]